MFDVRALSHPELEAAQRGTTDPFGCRVAIESYGAIIGWPLFTIGPLTLRGGEANWKLALAAAQPLWLGVAWDAIERLEHERRLDREAELQEAKEKATVAIVAWKEAKGLAVGDYPAIITEIEETTGKFGPQFQFQFVVVDADGDETDDEIRGWCSQKWGEKTNLYKWAKAILGKRCPSPGQPLDTDRLKGKKCDLRVVEKENGNTGIGEIFPYQTVSKASPEEDDELIFETAKV